DRPLQHGRGGRRAARRDRGVVTPVELLQQLIRYDTTNPPGNEADCVAFLRGLLEDVRCEVELYAKDPARPNLVARLRGRGNRPPLLLQGHVDVVTTAGQSWSRPPFGGDLVDGWVWGRGALDMKGGVAMMVSAFLRASSEAAQLPGDVVLTVLVDEEAGGDHGAKFLVEEHAHLFDGVEYAIGEFGGFNVEIGGRGMYLVQVAEKQICWLKASVPGRGGHGAFPQRGGTMARLARFLGDLDRKRLPVHITPATRAMIEGMAAAARPRPVRCARRDPPGARAGRCGRADGAGRRDGRALLRAARHSDLRLPPAPAPGRLPLHEPDPRRGRARARRRDRIRRRSRLPRVAARWLRRPTRRRSDRSSARRRASTSWSSSPRAETSLNVASLR